MVHGRHSVAGHTDGPLALVGLLCGAKGKLPGEPFTLPGTGKAPLYNNQFTPEDGRWALLRIHVPPP